MTVTALRRQLGCALRLEVPLGECAFEEAAASAESFRWEEASANRFIMNVTRPTLTLHLPGGDMDTPLPVVVVLPGGGYGGVSFDKEGNQVATWLNGLGFASAVVKYRCPPARDEATGLPTPFADVLTALDWIAAKAELLDVNPKRLGLMGFSAGGHLAGSIGLRFNELAGGRSLPRPSFLALVYPVVSADPAHGHTGSFKALEVAQVLQEEFLLARHLQPDSPPIFLAHALDDPAVPVVHSRLLEQAARRVGCPVAVHLCESGGHGFGMGTPGSEAASWLASCAAWLRAFTG